jgi:hypothetical protein
MMNQLLKRAVIEAERLPDQEQEELGQALMDMALRKKLDAELRAAIERGGSIPHDQVMKELRGRHGG